jgi:hypothetical protein
MFDAVQTAEPQRGQTMKTGTIVTRDELTSQGFAPQQLQFRTVDFSGPFCEWDTLGVIPNSAGLYAFVISPPDRPDKLRVTYVGLTDNLWMVTKGRLPNGSSRPAQRYGRHKYAGETRVRVNGLVAEAKRAGFDVTHWLSPRLVTSGERAQVALALLEEELIGKWDLRRAGWNRG